MKHKGHNVTKFLLIAGIGLSVFSLLIYQQIHDRILLLKPPATVLLEDRHGEFLSESIVHETAEIGYWTLSEAIPPRIEAAFLAIEDHRFYDHPGVDLRAVARAFWNNLTRDRRQGASTIAMQVARMQRDELTPLSSKRSYWNKLCESLTALFLIRKYGHQAVLTHYLHIMPQGNRIHGVAYAARRYFQKPLQDLSWAEAAVLAALPKAPGRMNLFETEGRELAFARAALILQKLYEQGSLNQDTLRIAQQQLHTLTIPEKEVRPEQSYHAILWLEEILQQQRTAPHSNLTHPLRASLDLRIQQKVTNIAQAALAHYRPAGAGNIAAIVVEKTSGKVRAYLGSADYFDAEYAGAINYARLLRSSGSTLKPFIYALGLERERFTPASLLSDAPILISLPRGYHQIGNSDGANLGKLLYRQALATSRNVPAIHVLMRVGLDNAYELFRQVGLIRDSHKTAAYYGVGMAIGTLYVTLEDLVAAYGVLANDGNAFTLRWFEDEIAESAREEQWIAEDAARQISLFLSDPLARLPVFARMGSLEYPFPVAVKTGTSQGFRDAWAVAYSGQYIVGVWLGHPEHTRMKDVSGQDAAQVVKQIMLFLHPHEQRGIQEHRFLAPEGYTLVQLCAQTGRPATATCPQTFPEYFRPGAEPQIRPSSSALTSAPQQNRQPFMPENPSYTLRIPSLSAKQLLQANIAIQEPRPGSAFVLDPDTPRSLQTISFQAQVYPTVSHIIWHVDGRPFDTTPYPYRVRWPLAPGTHRIQARFAHADIRSEIVTITVLQ